MSLTVKISSLFGLSLAYAGTKNDEVRECFVTCLEDFSFGYDVSAFCSIGLGLVFQGTGDDDIIGCLISVRF